MLESPDIDGTTHKKRINGQIMDVILDSSTGDFYSFNYIHGRWEPEGNVGIHKSGMGIGGVAAGIFADSYDITDGNNGQMVRICRRSIGSL